MVGCHVQSDNIQVYGNNDESHDNENPDKDVFDYGKQKRCLILCSPEIQAE